VLPHLVQLVAAEQMHMRFILAQEEAEAEPVPRNPTCARDQLTNDEHHDALSS